MKRSAWGLVFIGLLALSALLVGQISHRVAIETSPLYVLSTFNGTHENLRILFSRDALHFWGKTPDTYYNIDNLTRDPSITYYGGKYWVAHTHAISGGNLRDFYLTSSTDLINWSAPISVDTSAAQSGVIETWAPEWFLDPADSGLSSVHVFVMVRGLDTNHQIYEIHPTAADFSTWSTPVLITITGQSNVLDPFVVYKGSSYYLWFKDEATHYICYASSTTLTGTYTVQESGDWAGWGQPQEGPALLNLGGSPERWRIYMDDYQSSLTAGQLYYSDSTDDWANWTARVAINTPGQAKHGTMIQVP